MIMATYLGALKSVAAHDVECGRLENHLDGFEVTQPQSHVDGRLSVLCLSISDIIFIGLFLSKNRLYDVPMYEHYIYKVISF